MGSVVVLRAAREVALADEPHPKLGPGEVRVETLYSGISAGTELTFYRGSNPHLHRRWDDERRLFVNRRVEHPYPLAGFGYEEVGRVVAPAPGDLVWGAWGHRSSAVVPADAAAARVLPPGLRPIAGVFGRIGAIALNAVLNGEVSIGDTVAVFGLGVPGLLATQLARLSGASVVAVDRVERRLELARRFGARVVDVGQEQPAETIKALTKSRGADVSIELSGSYDALAEAVRATAANARVVAAGFYQGGGEALRLGEEFHHNRVQLVSSQISSVAPRLAGRWDRVRLEQTVMRLAAERRLELEALVSHVVQAAEAAEAFRLLDERPEEAVQVVLDFRQA